MTTLSVVLPNYNHARFLPMSLGAIFAQDRQPDEIIVIDDASRDNSIEVITALIAGRPHARLLSNEHNLGVIATLNAGLQRARGDLVYFAAADDVVLPGLFARSVELMERFPAAALCASLSRLLAVDGRDLGLFPGAIPMRTAGYIPPAVALHQLMRDDSWINGNTTIYRRDRLLSVGGFRADLASFTDGFAARALMLRHGACYIPEPLAAWRRLTDGYSSSVALDLEKSRALADRAWAVMTGEFSDVFPAAYADRWRRRYIFGAINFAAASRFRASRADPLRRAHLLAQWVAGSAYWFVRLRRFDIVPVAARRLKHLTYRYRGDAAVGSSAPASRIVQ
jgi:glycosyltransferase involved in cell wall biosynthesis